MTAHAMFESGAIRNALLIVPEKTKDGWKNEIAEKFPDIFTINDLTEIKARDNLDYLIATFGVMAKNTDIPYEKWIEIFDRLGIDPDFYACRARSLDEVLPWDIIDCGVNKSYLVRERERAYAEKTTPSCAEHCNGCGADRLGGKTKWCKNQ